MQSNPVVNSAAPAPTGHVQASAPQSFAPRSRSFRSLAHSFFMDSSLSNRIRDPLVEIAEASPRASVNFIKVMMFFSASANVVISIPCLIYLYWYWELCEEYRRPLRWWILTNCFLQLVQVPLRYIFFLILHRFSSTQRAFIVERLTQLTSSPAWRLSQGISVGSCGWFVIGSVWLFFSKTSTKAPGLWKLTVFVIVASMLRLLVTLACFSYYFPPRSSPRLSTSSDGRHKKGLTESLIGSLPVIKFTELERRKFRPEICTICLCGFEEGENLRNLPCRHSFHQFCIDKWLLKSASCPFCVHNLTLNGSLDRSEESVPTAAPTNGVAAAPESETCHRLGTDLPVATPERQGNGGITALMSENQMRDPFSRHSAPPVPSREHFPRSEPFTHALPPPHIPNCDTISSTLLANTGGADSPGGLCSERQGQDQAQNPFVPQFHIGDMVPRSVESPCRDPGRFRDRPPLKMWSVRTRHQPLHGEETNRTSALGDRGPAYYTETTWIADDAATRPEDQLPPRRETFESIESGVGSTIPRSRVVHSDQRCDEVEIYYDPLLEHVPGSGRLFAATNSSTITPRRSSRTRSRTPIHLDKLAPNHP